MAAVDDLGVILKKAESYLALLRSNSIAFDTAYLFGSYAKGTHHADSDIDIAIIADRWLPDCIDSRFELMKIASTIDSRIEPHPIERQRIMDNDPFVQEIIRTGREL